MQIVQKKQHKFLNMLYSGTQGILAMPGNDGLLEPAKAIWHQPTTAMAISKETEIVLKMDLDIFVVILHLALWLFQLIRREQSSTVLQDSSLEKSNSKI